MASPHVPRPPQCGSLQEGCESGNRSRENTERFTSPGPEPGADHRHNCLFQALFRCRKFTVRRHTMNKDSLPSESADMFIAWLTVPSRSSVRQAAEPYSRPNARQTANPSTEGPMWGHPMPVLGALSPFLEPFCGHLSPKLDKVS